MSSVKFNKIGVIGAGTMGQGIAEMLAIQNIEVYLVEKTIEKLNDAWDSIVMSLDKQIEKWSMTQAEKKLVLSRIHKVTGLNSLPHCEMIIETITENLQLKKQLFMELDQICSSDVILVSNTSTLSLTELAEETTRPERVIGLHFLHPVSKINLVEIIRGLKTSDDIFQSTKRFVEERINK